MFVAMPGSWGSDGFIADRRNRTAGLALIVGIGLTEGKAMMEVLVARGFRRTTLVLGSMLWLAGCYPAFRTVQPGVDLVVLDPAGLAVQGATVTLAAYRYPRAVPATTKFARYETDAAGTVSIPRRGDWQMEILLPDGSSWYGWRYCVEKAGYKAIASAETRRFERPLAVVLEPSRRSSKCQWPAEGEAYYDVKIVESE